MKKEVTFCDLCGKIIERGDKMYHLALESGIFHCGPGRGERMKYEHDFCEVCAIRFPAMVKKCLEGKEVDEDE